MEDVHQAKAGTLELYLLASELVIDVFLLFLDVLGAIGNLLKHDLHHVHLADCQTSHF